MKFLLCVAGLLIAAPAMGATGDVLVVAADDAELSRALVSAASQQFAGPVALAPSDWSGPVKAGTLRLRVVADGAVWHVVLAGPSASVTRNLQVTSGYRLDVAEAIALALPGLQSRLTARIRDLGAAQAERERVRESEHAADPTPPEPPPPPPPFVLMGPPIPPPELRAAPPPQPVIIEPRPARPPIVVAPPPPPPSSVFGASLTAGMLSAPHLLAGGLDGAIQLAFHGPWFGRLSVGGYGARYDAGPLWIIPIDVLVGARLTRGPVHLGAALGGELNVETVPSETGLVTSFVAQFDASVHVTPSWSIGARLATAFTTDSGESTVSSTPDLYIPQAQIRLGIVGMWETSEQ